MRLILFVAALLCALGVGVGLGLGLAPNLRGVLWAEEPVPAAVPPPPVMVPEEPEELPASTPVLASVETTTIELFQAARESVVAISVANRVTDPFTRRSVIQPVGSGSGFVWDDQGHIVTNNHVVEGRAQATVLLADGRSFDAELVGRDPVHDLAVLRISARDLPAALPVGQSGMLEVGQRVLAIGNPFGLDWTLTTGIISALDRELPGEGGGTIRGLIQTDAAINPGNSGGPLLDSSGRLIGVNTAIYSPSGASAGIGFAIPVNAVRRVVPQLIEQGRYTPPSLGVLYDQRINTAVNRQGLEGVLVLGVEPGSAAARAGLEGAQVDRMGRITPGDVIVGLQGQMTGTLDDYLAVLDALEPGQEVEVRIRRGRRERVVEMELSAGG